MPETSVSLRVHVHARSARERIEHHGDEIQVWVLAPPIDGRANRKVLELIAQKLAWPVSRLEIARGNAGRWKVVVVYGLDREAVLARLRT